jgi:hypothetical protein
MTGRDLDTTTVGIAYLKNVCGSNNAYAVSLSQSGLNTTQAALIAAHEIGHNFGAPHDGEGACASTPQTFLMAPQLNGNDKFSSCSVSQIQAVINTATCFKDYVPPDASIDITNGTVNGTVGAPVSTTFKVAARGDDASSNVSVAVAVPAGLTVNVASVNGGTCQINSASSVSCSLGTLAGGDTRQVDLNVTPTTAGTLTLNVSVDSANDPNSSNDSGTITVNASASGTPPPSPPPTSGTSSSGDGGGGGGGSLDLSLLSLLSLATLMGVYRRRLRLPER